MDIARASIQRYRIVLFICLLTLIGGVRAYFEKTPSFTVRTAVYSCYDETTAATSDEAVR